MEKDIVLRLENVTKRYQNGVKALDGISFDVARGEFVAIIGPSGAGKSTILRSINRLIDVTEGSVLVGNEDVTKLRGKGIRRVRRKIGMVFQNYNLVGRLSVMQNVLHGRLGYMSDIASVFGRYGEKDKERALHLLSDIGLHDFIYNRASDLSGGQKQRVGVARAFMQNPDILLCDEPIASLDPSSSKIVMDSIRDLSKREGIACVVNLHQIDVALQYATRIIGLRQGKIVYDGVPQELSRQTIEEIYNTSFEDMIMGHGEANEAV